MRPFRQTLKEDHHKDTDNPPDNMMIKNCEESVSQPPTDRWRILVVGFDVLNVDQVRQPHLNTPTVVYCIDTRLILSPPFLYCGRESQ